MEKEKALELLMNWFENQNNEEITGIKKPISFDKKIILESYYEVYLKCITWKQLLNINSKSFGKNDEGNFLNSQKQKRQVLELAINQVLDLKTKEVYKENLLNILEFEAVEYIWQEYQSILHLSSDETNLIYNSAKKYFSGSEEYYPIVPEVLEIDYITKGIVSLTKNEFNSLSNKEFEIMQLVLATKNEITKKNSNFP